MKINIRVAELFILDAVAKLLEEQTSWGRNELKARLPKTIHEALIEAARNSTED